MAKQARPGPQRKLFATLTDIRQTGTSREWDGTTTYSFVATVAKGEPPIVIALTITPALHILIDAHFDERQRTTTQERDESA